jgi:hypothetical protein
MDRGAIVHLHVFGAAVPNPFKSFVFQPQENLSKNETSEINGEACSQRKSIAGDAYEVHLYT